MRFAISLLAVCSLTALVVDAADVELSVPARLLRSPRAAQSAQMQEDREPSEPPTVVRGLLPQYQSAETFRSEMAAAPDPSSTALRFLLVIPDRVILLEVYAAINGEPFRRIREQRIDRLIADLEAPIEQQSGPTDAEVRAEEVPPAPEQESADGERADEAVTTSGAGSSSLAARLKRYAAATGRTPTRDEIRWLLTKWVDGPTLLLLDQNFQRFRGSQMPAFHVLDRDLDGVVSASELKDADHSLSSCDENQNDVVEFTEIAEVADDPRRKRRSTLPPALIPLLDQASASKAFRRIATQFSALAGQDRFDQDRDGELGLTEFASLSQLEPDVSVTVSFDAADASKSAIGVSKLASTFDRNRIRKVKHAITIPLGETWLEFSAVQSRALSQSDQFSVGVVNDGYPLLPALDPNDDGRLTIREMRKVADYLHRFDANADGSISIAEIPGTVRVAFGLGPTVHRHLADLRRVHPPVRKSKVDVPDWFTTMDRNKDGDLSPREFMLSREEFDRIDADSDELISPSEAVQSTAQETSEENPRRKLEK